MWFIGVEKTPPKFRGLEQPRHSLSWFYGLTGFSGGDSSAVRDFGWDCNHLGAQLAWTSKVAHSYVWHLDRGFLEGRLSWDNWICFSLSGLPQGLSPSGLYGISPAGYPDFLTCWPKAPQNTGVQVVRAPWGLGLEHFCHILLAKARHKVRPDSVQDGAMPGHEFEDVWVIGRRLRHRATAQA